MFYALLALWIVRGGGPVSIQPTDPAAIPPPVVALRDPDTERRALCALLRMASFDALEARSNPDRVKARAEADALLDEWLTKFGTA